MIVHLPRNRTRSPPVAGPVTRSTPERVKPSTDVPTLPPYDDDVPRNVSFLPTPVRR